MSEDQDWILVPRLATKAMLDAAYAAYDAFEASNEPCGWGGLGSVYKAMIAAAPKPDESLHPSSTASTADPDREGRERA